MIGKFQMQYGATELTSGMAASDYANDGALSTSSYLLNPFATPGLMRAMATSTDLSSPVADYLIASCEDWQQVGGFARLLVGSAANYYTYNGTSITKQATGAAVTKYIVGKTDMVSFAGATYVTQVDDIAQWVTSSPTVITESWWVTTKSQSSLNSFVPHPLQVYQGNMYIADANQLHTLANDGTTIATGVLVLNSNEIIQAMHIDPMTGLMMLSVTVGANLNDTLSTANWIYLYDGISPKPLRKIPTDDLITGFHSCQGVVYVGQGQILGQWNGNGVTFLRKMQNVTLTSSPNTDLLYKHKFANVRNILHVVDGQNILSYGTVLAGGKQGFFYTGASLLGTDHISMVSPGGSNTIIIGYNHATVPKALSWDFSATTGGNGILFFNYTYFPRPVYIRRMRVITTGITTNAGIGLVYIIDEKGNTVTPTASTFLVTAAQSPRYDFDFEFTNLKLMGMKPLVNFGGTGEGIVRVIIYYDIAE